LLDSGLLSKDVAADKVVEEDPIKEEDPVKGSVFGEDWRWNIGTCGGGKNEFPTGS
jgi:hypothetical protein